MQCYIFSERKKEKNVLLSCKIQSVMYNLISEITFGAGTFPFYTKDKTVLNVISLYGKDSTCKRKISWNRNHLSV